MANIIFTLAIYTMYTSIAIMLFTILGLIIELSLGNKEWYNKLWNLKKLKNLKS